MIGKLNIDLSQTSEKFQHLAHEILEFLIGKLLLIDALEQEIYDHYQVLEEKRVSPNQTHPDEEDLWDEYAHRCKEIIAPISTKRYNDSRSFGKPTAYEYLGYPTTKISLIMKSENRAVVETYFEYGIAKKEQFIVKNDNNGWKIDSKKYGYPNENKWWKDEI